MLITSYSLVSKTKVFKLLYPKQIEMTTVVSFIHFHRSTTPDTVHGKLPPLTIGFQINKANDVLCQCNFEKRYFANLLVPLGLTCPAQCVTFFFEKKNRCQTVL
jgi:hypothetical protein